MDDCNYLPITEKMSSFIFPKLGSESFKPGSAFKATNIEVANGHLNNYTKSVPDSPVHIDNNINFNSLTFSSIQDYGTINHHSTNGGKITINNNSLDYLNGRVPRTTESNSLYIDTNSSGLLPNTRHVTTGMIGVTNGSVLSPSSFCMDPTFKLNEFGISADKYGTPTVLNNGTIGMVHKGSHPLAISSNYQNTAITLDSLIYPTSGYGTALIPNNRTSANDYLTGAGSSGLSYAQATVGYETVLSNVGSSSVINRYENVVGKVYLASQARLTSLDFVKEYTTLRFARPTIHSNRYDLATTRIDDVIGAGYIVAQPIMASTSLLTPRDSMYNDLLRTSSCNTEIGVMYLTSNKIHNSGCGYLSPSSSHINQYTIPNGNPAVIHQSCLASSHVFRTRPVIDALLGFNSPHGEIFSNSAAYMPNASVSEILGSGGVVINRRQQDNFLKDYSTISTPSLTRTTAIAKDLVGKIRELSTDTQTESSNTDLTYNVQGAQINVSIIITNVFISTGNIEGKYIQVGCNNVMTYGKN